MAEQIVIEFTADISKLQPAIDALEQLGQIDKKSAEIFRATNAEYQNRAKEVNKLSQAYTNLSEEVASGGIKEHANDLKKTTDEIVKQKGETENLTKKLRAMVRELALMKQEGRDNTEQFKQMSREAGKLADDIGDAREQVKVLSSDTKKLDALATAFRGVAAGMSVATGATALFGEENKDLQKTLLQVQGAMAVLTGVQELASIATGQNTLKTYLLDGAQKAVAVSARAMGISVQAASALMTLGISAVVAGVIYLISELQGANEEADKLREKSLEFQKQQLDAQRQITDLRVSLIRDGKRRELAEQKVAEIRELNSLKTRLKQGQITGEQYEELYTLTKLKGAKDRDDIEERYKAKNIERKKKENKEVEKIARQQIKIEAELRRVGFVQSMDDYSSFDAAQLAASKEFNMKQEDLMDEFYKSGIEDFEVFLAAKRKELEDDAKLQAAIIAATFQGLSDISNAAFEIDENNRKKRLDSELNFLDRQRDAILQNERLTESQREAIQRQFEQKKRAAQIQAWKSGQEAAIAQAVINGALAIGNALATVKPFPAALVAAASVAVSTAAQTAVIRSQPMPQFAEGSEFVEGAGTGTSDSITAKLSRGERVVTAKTNKDYFDGLSVIHNRLVAPELVNTLLTNIAENGGMLEMPADKIKGFESASEGIDYEKLTTAMQKGRSVVEINMDERGFVKHIKKGLNSATYHNTKLRLRA